LARDARFPARAAFLPPSAFRTVLLNPGLSAALDTGLRPEALGYLAPERLRGGPPAPAADRYALGALAYLLLAGQLPFPHQHPGALAMAHLCQPAPDPRRRVVGFPAPMALALLRMLAKDPAGRFATAREFVAALGQE
jgi:serine/threonine-protein kinase